MSLTTHFEYPEGYEGIEQKELVIGGGKGPQVERIRLLPWLTITRMRAAQSSFSYSSAFNGHRFSLYSGKSDFRGTCYIEGVAHAMPVCLGNSISIVPDGQQMFIECHTRLLRVTSVVIEEEQLLKTSTVLPAATRLAPIASLEAPFLRNLLTRFVLMASSPEINSLYMESFAAFVLREAARCQGSSANLQVQTSGRFDVTQARMVSEYVEKHLARDVLLEEVAELVQLGPGFFSRIFRQTLGMSFEQYVSRRRAAQTETSLPERRANCNLPR
ncbi:hypothetical protein B0G80_1192 [Paraburkholderia sp. BL6669N2]|uniref:AraC family transcriptional regulator n=1 Tax=Paraburkholderia sp. BL6669N2 TaxID=1938807 RepID=UPI000E24DB74|nr:AraC family transcriptional regulator [Paraburkholderia sp. BL6669N2]REG58534.1 hypothetical protein B0G80_1192 [Paraburkholderia sp. BL6669N2]